MKTIRVALADDHPVVLAGIKSLLDDAADISLVGEARTGSAALDIIQEVRPDVAVIDISLPDMNGLELVRRLSQACPAVRLLVLTVHEDRAYVQPLLQAGARGYILKRSAGEDLARAIRSVAEGGVYLDPSVAEKAFSEPRRDPLGNRTETYEELSPRETEVLRYTARGFSNKEIAAELKVSIKTVETYKARACEKIGLHSRAAIVRYGALHGWLDGLSFPTDIKSGQ